MSESGDIDLQAILFNCDKHLKNVLKFITVSATFFSVSKMLLYIT